LGARNSPADTAAQLGKSGVDVAWDGDIELVAGTLHQLAPEQAREVVPTSICEKPIS